MPLSDLDQALLELALQRGVLTETSVHRIREAVSAKGAPGVESAIADQVDGATFQALCKDLPAFYAERLKTRKPPAGLASMKQFFGVSPAPAPRKIGRYVIEGELGRGALGVVYRVRAGDTNETFALKVLSAVADATASERFLREMDALAKVRHRNIVRIVDAGEDGEKPFYVMELVTGSALSDLVERDGALAPGTVLGIARDLLSGLGAIHAQSIVHRDVKPANVLLDASGRAVLIDFSVVLVAGTSSALTKEGFSVGTPVYMAPEQVAGEPTGPATDLYGLGVTLFVALEGRSPYGPLATYDALADAKLEEPPPPVTRAGVPPGFVRFIEKLMATAPVDRYASAALALLALEQEIASPGRANPALGGYELLETVSLGEHAAVYRARSLASRAPAALKALGANADPAALARLTRAARTMGRVKHENVVSLLEGGTADGRAFLALEWIEGESLEKLCSRGPLPLETVLAIGVELARGLAAVHERNVLHRGLEPGNVLVTEGAKPRISGFSLAKIEGDEEEPPLPADPGYAAPELARGEPATRRSDLYALGAILHRMASGRAPGSEPPGLAAIRPEAAPLAPIVAALLAKDKEQRYASAALLAADLELMASGNEPRSLPGAPPASGGKPWWKIW